jgi:GT2 family glycosyltransferase
VSATPQIGVVVCAYADDRWADLADALAALAAQSRPPAEVVLVVDHNPRLLEQAAAAFERVRVVPNSEPRGLSGAS